MVGVLLFIGAVLLLDAFVGGRIPLPTDERRAMNRLLGQGLSVLGAEGRMAARVVAAFLGFGLVLVLFLIGGAVTQSGDDEIVYGTTLAAGGALVLLVWRMSAAFTQPDATNLLASDRRAPVLYLRSFSEDWRTGRSFIAGFAARTRSYEEQLVSVLQDLGPVIAISEPGTELAPVGAARLPVTDRDWKAEVQRLTAESAFVCIRLSDSPGVRWEIEHLVRACPPTKLALALPRDRAATAEQVAQLGKLFPRGLPAQDASDGDSDEAGTGGFVAFGADWTPNALEIGNLVPHLSVTGESEAAR